MTFKNLSTEELKEIIDSKKKIILIDVRTEREHNKEKIPNTNFLIPFNEIVSRHKEINTSLKEEKIILYCRSGNRSAIAAQTLVKLGYKNLFNLEKGIIEWRKYNKTEKPINQEKNTLTNIISIFRR